MRGPTTAWPGATLSRSRAAGLHNVDARVRRRRRRHGTSPRSGDGLHDSDGVGVFLGLDVGKTAHHGHGLTPARRSSTSPCPTASRNCEPCSTSWPRSSGPCSSWWTSRLDRRPALTVARDAGCKVAYLPGLAMRRIADLYPGEAKTDAKDAAVIADAARTMPHTLRSLELTDEITAELTVLAGFDQDLASEATRTSNRIRGLLTQFHPSLERVLGPRLDHQAVTWLLERHGSPAALRKAGRRRLVELVRPKAPRMAQRLIDEVFDALDEQTVVVPGTGTLDIVIPSLARSLAAVHEQRRALEAQIQTLLEAHPLAKVLTSMPGVAVRTAAVLLVTVGDGTSFPTAAHLASYAGLAPATKSSGTSIHGEHAPRGGNRQLKRAMFLSAFAALHDPASRTYYDKCRARGKTHTQALLRLARHRISVLFAMLRDGTFYEPRAPRLT
ncbi:IS110 family transposase [Streptomyces mobaraensis]|uniref:IS110 family transposase n=1 Tax=Streptomyces mobaraensis TaxID=35621 RepID=UPI001FA818C8|nr:IS110 family transposase [Streptomyces mobaraensis]